MISYGWRLVGSRDNVPTSADGISVVQSDFPKSTCPYMVLDGFAYVRFALLHTGTGNVPEVAIHGTNFTGESAQGVIESGTALNEQLTVVAGAAAGVAVPAGTIKGVDVDTEWSSIASVSDITSSGNGHMLGMVSMYAGFKGAEVAETGGANNTYGHDEVQNYHAILGSASVLGTVTIPCGLYSAFQFDLYSDAATDDVFLIACPFG